MLCFDPYTIPNLSRGVEQNYYCNQKQRGMVNEGTIFYRCPCSPKYFSGYNLVVHKMEPVETRKLAMRSIQVKKEGDVVKNPFLAKTLKTIASKGVDYFYHGLPGEYLIGDISKSENSYLIISFFPLLFLKKEFYFYS